MNILRMFCSLLILRPFSQPATSPAEADRLNCPQAARTLLGIAAIYLMHKGTLQMAVLLFGLQS